MSPRAPPVYWELVEPEEGRFDFALVDGLVEQARGHDMRLVLLWFGSWKNSMSSYAPAWVKRDQDRFPRARTSDGRALEILSPFHEASRDADARAFAALMGHLSDFDGGRHTVLMVLQVEDFEEDDPLGGAYRVLRGLAPLVLEHQALGTIAGVRPVVAFDGAVDESPQDVRLGDFTLHVRFVDPWTPASSRRSRPTAASSSSSGPRSTSWPGRGSP